VGPWGSFTYTIDGVGNILTRVKAGTPNETVAFGLAAGTNRLSTMSVNGTQTRQFASDAAGNLTGDNNTASTTNKVLAYNHPGQIKSATVNGTVVGNYRYNYLFRLVARELPQSLTTLHTVHDLDGNVIAKYSASGTLLREYIWLDGQPVAVIADTGTASPKTLWVYNDYLGRPLAMADANAAVVWAATSQPFGAVQAITGTASNDGRFPGQWFQLETGLLDNWHRHYSTAIERWWRGPVHWWGAS
jgi:hypothetical protein